MKKAITTEWVDINKTEIKSVVNIVRNYILIKGKHFKCSILRTTFL